MKNLNTIALCLLFLTPSLWADATVDSAWSALQGGVANKSADKRARAIHSLSLLPSQPKAQTWAEHALTDDNPNVRAAAAESLGAMGAKSSAGRLKDALKDKEIAVVVAAANALYLLKDPAAYDIYYALVTGERKSKDGLIQSQLDTLKDHKKLEKMAIETGVGFVPFGGMTMEAVKTITADDSSPVRATAVSKLAQDPDPKTTEALRQACYDKKWRVRLAAVDAIAERGDRSLADALEPVLNDDNDAVKYDAAAAIIHLDSVKAGKRRR